MSSNTWSHHIVLPPLPISAYQARAFVRQRLVDHGLMRLIDDVQLITSELATNAVLHTQEPFTVTLRREGPLVVLAIRDSSLLLPLPSPIQAMDTQGRGLVVVDSFSHDWGIDRRTGWAKSVWASFELTAEE